MGMVPEITNSTRTPNATGMECHPTKSTVEVMKRSQNVGYAACSASHLVIGLCLLLFLVLGIVHSLDVNHAAIVSCGAISVFSHQWFPWLCGGFPQNTLIDSIASAFTVARFGTFDQHVFMAGTIALLFFAFSG